MVKVKQVPSRLQSRQAAAEFEMKVFLEAQILTIKMLNQVTVCMKWGFDQPFRKRIEEAAKMMRNCTQMSGVRLHGDLGVDR